MPSRTSRGGLPGVTIVYERMSERLHGTARAELLLRLRLSAHEHDDERQRFGVISKTTRSSCGGESRKVKISLRRASSVICLAVQDNVSPLTVISTAGFLIIFWHQCLPRILLDVA